ncbi:hypothetical protein N9Z64_02330 [bacterium]|nr:hypothetical protein [Rhodopirellula sp.]MDB4353543.1 hypothetical protein [bacterium]MDB4540111.1 hypothetical protein [bacterium]
MKGKRSKPRAGLTILEVLISIAVLLFAMTGVSTLINNGLRSSVDGQARIRAATLCNSKMAEILSGDGPANIRQGEIRFPPPYETWAWQSALTPSVYPNLSTLTIEVFPHSAKSTDIRFELSRLILTSEIANASRVQSNGESSF